MHSPTSKGSAAHREILDEMLGLVAQLSIEDELPASLQQQQLIKGLKDVDAGLVDGAHNCPACVDNVTHRPHHNSCCSRIQACISSFVVASIIKPSIYVDLLTHVLIHPSTHPLLAHAYVQHFCFNRSEVAHLRWLQLSLRQTDLQSASLSLSASFGM